MAVGVSILFKNIFLNSVVLSNLDADLGSLRTVIECLFLIAIPEASLPRDSDKIKRVEISDFISVLVKVTFSLRVIPNIPHII